MIHSMTAFARCMRSENWGVLTWELRTANHRFLEIIIRCPEVLRELEVEMRDTVKKHIKRGKLEASLNYLPGAAAPLEMTVNSSVVRQLASAQAEVAKMFPSNQINTLDILAWPGVLQNLQKSSVSMQTAALELLNEALQHCLVSRAREGESIKQFMLARLQSIKTQIASIEIQIPHTIKNYQAKIANRFNEYARLAEKNTVINEERLEQEILWLVQKGDISEELQRLKTHVSEAERVIMEGGVVGRRIDFLMQELNREANTLGSKSSDCTISQAAVELKVLIEQTREQVQNIE